MLPLVTVVADQRAGFTTQGGGAGGSGGDQPNFLMRLLGIGQAPPKRSAGGTAMRLEPKTFFANERTFLSWLHMSVTIGSIAAALLGFAGRGGCWDGGCVALLGQGKVMGNWLLIQCNCG